MERYSIVGMTYDALIEPLGSKMRLIWLKRGARLLRDFHPQPYQQLAKVLQESGHRREARAILIAKEREQRRDSRRRWRAEYQFRRILRLFSSGAKGITEDDVNTSSAKTEEMAARILVKFKSRHSGPNMMKSMISYDRKLAQLDFRNSLFFRNVRARFRIFVGQVWDWVFRSTTGYGYAPWLSINVLGGFVFAYALVAYCAWEAGDFAPKSAIVLISREWQEIANVDGGLTKNAAAIWSSRTEAGRDYETFDAFSYAVDVVLPLVDLGQEAAWSPSPARGSWGVFAFYTQKVFIILGWVVAAVFAGAVTGVIRRDD